MAGNHERDLGRFVRSRTREDGTDHVFMSVPAELRPTGWPPTISLPSEAKRAGRLNDPIFLAKVQREAAILNTRLDQRRHDEEVYRSDRRNARALAEIYFRTQRYRALSDARKYRNRRDALLFAKWAEDRADPDFATLMKPDFEDFLAIYDDRPSQRLELRSTLSILCGEAIEARWRTDNPIAKLKWTAPPPAREVVLWTDEVAQAFAAMAAQMQQPGLGALILFGLRSGQRLGDLRKAKHGVNYRPGMFQVKQSKTGALVKFPVPGHLHRLIESVRVEGSDYIFNDGDTGTSFDPQRLGARFREVRHALANEGDPLMQLATLRHSAVCRMERADISLLQIAAVTGHNLARVHTIITRYAVDREGFAASAMMKLHQADGGHADDFIQHDPFKGSDSGGGLKSTYRAPKIDPGRPGQWLGALHGQHRLAYSLPAVNDLWEDDDADELSA